MADKHDSKLSEAVGGKKFGSYTESTGGGTPLKKGEKLADHPEAERVMQPRDEDGKFTYNSVNGHSLKYGPSRGTTEPPFLKGQNGKILVEGSILKDAKGKAILSTIDMTQDEYIAACKHWISNGDGTGHFMGMGEGSSIGKKGAQSKTVKTAEQGNVGVSKVLSPEEQARASKAKTSYQEDAYKDVGGKKYTLKDIVSKKTQPTQSVPTPTPAPTPTPTQPTQSVPVTPSGQKVQQVGSQDDAQAKKQENQQPQVKTLDQNLAKTDKAAFIKQNFQEIENFKNEADKLGFDIDVDQMVDAIANGDFASFDEILNVLKAM